MTKVKAILIDIDGEEKRLTIAEAKALHDALGELVGSNTQPIPMPIQPYSPTLEPYINPLRPYFAMDATEPGNFSIPISERMSVSATSGEPK